MNYLEGGHAQATVSIVGIEAGAAVLARIAVAAVQLDLRLQPLHLVLHDAQSRVQTSQQQIASPGPAYNT